MAISIHGRMAVNDSMLLHRAARRFALFHLFPARGSTKPTGRLKYRTMWWPWPMSKVEDGNAFIIFFSPITHRHEYKSAPTTGTTPPPYSRREFIFGSARYRWFIVRPSFPHSSAPRITIFPPACFGKEEKMATSYLRVKAHARWSVVFDMSCVIMWLAYRKAVTGMTMLRDILKI